MKKFVCGLLVGIMLTLGITTYAIPEIKEAKFSPDIALVVNGERLDTEIVSVVTTDKPGYMTNYVPARALSEALGATVTWDGKSRIISVDTVKKDVANNATTPITQTQSIDLPSATEIRGIKAVAVADVYKALKARNYDLINAAQKDTLQIVKDDKIVVRNITFILSNDNYGYIKYDFYEEYILPLLQ